MAVFLEKMGSSSDIEMLSSPKLSVYFSTLLWFMMVMILFGYSPASTGKSIFSAMLCLRLGCWKPEIFERSRFIGDLAGGTRSSLEVDVRLKSNI